jgi:hypothetical protein
MRFLIRFVLSLFLVTPAVAFAQTRISSKDFKIISATVTDWSSGTARENSDGTRGVQYEIKAIVKSKTGVVIDSLITENGSMEVEVIVGLRRNLGKAEIRKSDTVQIITRLQQGQSQRALSNETRKVISKSAKAKQFSFLLYRNKEKRCLMPVGEFSKKSARQPNQ